MLIRHKDNENVLVQVLVEQDSMVRSIIEWISVIRVDKRLVFIWFFWPVIERHRLELGGVVRHWADTSIVIYPQPSLQFSFAG